MVIQCREEMFNTICDTLKKEPYIVEQSGGYIDCFDKGWVFISVDDNSKLIKLITKNPEAQYIIGLKEKPLLIQQNISENEQYIFVRKDTDTKTYDILWGASSFIKFKED